MNEIATQKRSVARTVWQVCDGELLGSLMQAGLFQLNHHVDQVNALNVFPVPDGDTGTNMRLTMVAASERLATVRPKHVGEAAQLLARGALMGARGNSGVILSQILQGFAEPIQDDPVIDTATFAAGLRNAATVAWLAVSNPVEGTILTVCNAIADSAENAMLEHNDLCAFLEKVLADGRIALANTPNQLPILKKAGVVDSGGQGLIYILEGMVNRLKGDLSGDILHSGNSTRPTTITHSAQQLVRPEDGIIPFKYDVQFILSGQNLDQPAVRLSIEAMGDSAVVVGDGEVIKVHIHVDDPGKPLSYGATLGDLSDIVVENMQEQMEQLIAAGQAAIDLDSAEITHPSHPTQINVVAITPGSGIADAMRSLGVSSIVDGGQTNNPSTEQILHAIEQTPGNNIIVLPNNKNIIMAAQSAADLSSKAVKVIPSSSIPQGFAALMSLDATGELEEVAAAMVDSAEEITSAQIATAIRDANLNGLAIKTGHYIGLINNDLCAADATLPTLLETLLSNMPLEQCELITLFYGADVTKSEARDVVSQIETHYPDLEIELIEGGQAHYLYILGAE